MIELNQDDFYLMIGSAIRYAVGRTSYITTCAAKWIEDYSKFLTPDQRGVILRDILEYGKNGNSYGDLCDEAAWLKCANILLQQDTKTHLITDNEMWEVLDRKFKKAVKTFNIIEK